MLGRWEVHELELLDIFFLVLACILDLDKIFKCTCLGLSVLNALCYMGHTSLSNGS